MNPANKPFEQASSMQSPLKWSFSSWFGAIVGSTCWMLCVAGVLIYWREVFVAAIPIANFILVNLLALGLWLRRSRLSPFHGLMTILAAMAIALPMTWFSVMHFASPQVLAAMHWPKTFYSMFVVALMVPGVMLRFWILERQAATSGFAKRH